MKRTLLAIGVSLTLGALFSAGIAPARAQSEYKYIHQDLNSVAARALRQQIMNDAIRRQATGKSGHASRKKQTRRRASHTASHGR